MSSLPRHKTHKLTVVLVLLVQLSVSACAGLFGQDHVKGQKEMQAGEAQLSAGNLEAALKHFRSAVRKDRRHAPAYFEMGKIYRDKNTIENRRWADNAFRKAVQFDPGNAAYHMALAQLHLDRDLIGSAEKAFRRVVQLDSSNADAWYQLARIREDEYLYYAHMVNGDSSSGGSVHFDSFANADKEKSIRLYEESIQQNPDFLEAYYRLGFLYYESRNWLAMKAIFEDAVNRGPLDKNANLYLALAYYRLGHMDKADRRYKIAWRLMEEDERSTYTAIWPLISPDRREEHQSGPNSETAFWRQRDPLFLTDYNERHLEHFARIAYANLRFSDPEKAAGWETDQGKVYIRYGMPLNKSKRGATLADTGLGGGSPFVGSTETWTYAGFEFVFEDAFHTRNYRFKWGMGANNDYKDIYRRMIKSVPETYSSPYRENAFAFPVIARQFMRPDGETVIYFYSGVSKKEIDMMQTERSSPRNASLQRGLFLFDDDWTEISKSIDGLSLRPNRMDASQEHLTVLDSISVPPGDYHFAVEFLQPATRQVGSTRDSLKVREFPSQSLSLSDLVLARKIRLRTGISNINRGQIVVAPSYDTVFRPGQDIHLYYEIYQLGLDSNGSSNYTISHTIKQKITRRSTINKFLRFLTRKTDDLAAVVSQFEYKGDLERENHYRILQLKDYASGDYELEVRVKDNQTNRISHQTISFQIVAREP